MPSTRELRRRIRSIKNTAQITKAMEMVAATKMRKAQHQAFSGRPYNIALNQLLHRLLDSGNKLSHPLLQSNNSSKVGILLITTNKSLCGALNTNLFRLIQKDYSGANYSFFTLGQKGRQFVVRTGKDLVADFENTEIASDASSRTIRKILVENFLSGSLGQIKILFPDFVSTLTQAPTTVDLLPININNFLRFLSSTVKTESAAKSESKNNFLFEPSLSDLLEYALLHYLDVTIYQAILESKASEHSARMISMQNATNNAKDIVSDLTLTYNQIRQEAITRELLEIASAQAALE